LGASFEKTSFSVHVTALVEPGFQVFDELARTLMPRAEDSAWFAEDLEQAVYGTYRGLALGFVEPDRREECEEAMRGEGFRRVIDGRPELARSLALAGLMSSCRRRNEFAEPMFAYHGLDFANCRRKIEACARRWGYPLLSPDPSQETPLDPKGHIACMV
jgi:hypothetical protein